jgi:hypothetical protein
MGGGANPLVAEPLPQTAGELRENRGQLRCSFVASRRHDLLETNNFYLRIISKAIRATAGAASRVALAASGLKLL